MRFLTVREAAAKARVAENTLRRWAKEGTIPSIKPAKFVLIPEADLDAFLMGNGSGLERYVAAVVDGAPDLTDDQIQRLREVLGR